MLTDKLIKIRFWILEVLLLIVFPVIVFLGAISVIYKKIFTKPKSINGEVALITGSANGLGKQIGIGLAKKGCHIAVADINIEAAEKTSTELSNTYKIKSKAFKVDVTQYENIAKLAKEVEKQLGPVTILVNNAGIMTFKKYIKPTPEEIQNMINTNLTSHVYTIRLFLERMRELGKGHIVAICSIAGLMPCHRQLEYTASKFGVRGLMKVLRTELYALNADFIQTTTVCPYFLKTNSIVDELFHKIGGSDLYPSISGEEAAEAIVEGIVRNEMEILIPSITALNYRLFELLPASWNAKLFNSMTSREVLKDLDNS
ncbi:short-chain dehydrogenase/reductase family 16C member 6 [Episyrphus balteatus]|uniref:short-chain dehydrogenase/reductase family 16C member 6 n=1 Tax=Episyrphus balteatus TaxID=286459 RepID=UPI002486B88D|nr:short-chain dehydrogenase/reductase family 16C member 6 [Episyrphus balteatus]